LWKICDLVRWKGLYVYVIYDREKNANTTRNKQIKVMSEQKITSKHTTNLTVKNEGL
jgi:hypothetical protein